MATTTLAILCLAAALSADAGGAALWLTIGQWVFNAFAAGFGWWIKRRVENTDKLEERVAKQAEQLIDQRLHGLALELDRIMKRLERGESDFKSLGNRDHTIELQIRTAFDSLKDYIRESCASKDDVKVLNKKVDHLQIAVAQLQGGQA
jgi:hypothetical protein